MIDAPKCCLDTSYDKSLIRLDVFLRQAGIGNRNTIRTMAQAGRISLDGKPIYDSSYRLNQKSIVSVDGQPIASHQKVTLMLNKPKGTVCTASAQEENSVFLILPEAYRHLFSIGRLDRDTTGLLLFTNDGVLCRSVIDPLNRIKKEYEVTVTQPFPPDAGRRFAEGIELESGAKCLPAEFFPHEDGMSADIRICEGKRHQIKRMVAALGTRVHSLRRTAIGNLRLPKQMKTGTWKILSDEEIQSIFDNSDLK